MEEKSTVESADNNRESQNTSKYNGWLVSESLLKRSLAVVGHHVIGNIIIAIILIPILIIIALAV